MAFSNKLSYHRRLFAGLVLYSVILVACVAIFQYHREKSFKAEELNQRLQMYNDRLLDEIAESNESSGRFGVIPHSFEDLRVSVLDTCGNVISDNSLDTLPGSNHLNRKEIADAMKRGEGFCLRRHSKSTGNTYFYSAKKRGEYIVRTAVPYTVSLHQLLSADYGFLWFLVGVTFVMCVIGYFVIGRLGTHIRRLKRFAESAERGERITDADPFPHDELGDISNNIVRLYARLQHTAAERDREHRAALREGKEKERIKRQLTNNINHELKTPVASMNVCLETLMTHKNMSSEKREEFIARCYRANERLRRLLADISAITRLEDGGESIVAEELDLACVVADVCEEFAAESDVKGVKIRNQITGSYPMEGNRDLLASIFRNLISNSLAYSGCSEISIAVKNASDHCIELSVADNGCGIEEVHLTRIFERFYRIDKGRSRQAGGTGLGLSIVKNAVAWHGGDIKAQNCPEGGVEFIFCVTRMKQL